MMSHADPVLRTLQLLHRCGMVCREDMEIVAGMIRTELGGEPTAGRTPTIGRLSPTESYARRGQRVWTYYGGD